MQREFPYRDPRGHGRGRGGRGPYGGPADFGGAGFGPGVGPGQFGPGGRGRGRGGRGRRGDVRAAILLLLKERPMHGYELIQEIASRSDGVWRPSPGSVYPALSQLEDEGHVVVERLAGRKTARLTESGTEYVEATDLGTPWDDVRAAADDGGGDLRRAVGALTGAAGQVAVVGTDAQRRRAVEIVDEARRSLYRLLADDLDPERTDSADGADLSPRGGGEQTAE
ncbi:PadR family transcriptional regulator [Rhodococcus rhodnii]|nr:PadR family transcriptional regulator [Rhodococcus rhodnii]TXG92688.1 PadR family transcriptional regulator [Rhodococcus rhodnii]